MSNSELILVKAEEENIEFDIEFRDEEWCEEATSIYSSSSNDHHEEEINREEAASKGTVEDDDDGFKTPTSMDHKIPEMKQCPGAPRKPKANKRKLSSTSSANASCNIGMNHHDQLLLDLSEEVESWFPSSIVKVKRARTQENQ